VQIRESGADFQPDRLPGHRGNSLEQGSRLAEERRLHC